MLRNVADRFSHQHQLQIAWVTFLELDKIPEQGRAVFALINSTDINIFAGMQRLADNLEYLRLFPAHHTESQQF